MILATKHRRIMTNQSGQAAILGVLCLVILCIGMYTTAHIGRAVSEKIYLQNVADVTAYSMAVTEARAMNFVAFCNRTQVAHYSAILSLYSLNSKINFYAGVIGTVTDYVNGVAGVIATACDNAPIFKFLCHTAFDGILYGIATGLQSFLSTTMNPTYVALYTMQNIISITIGPLSYVYLWLNDVYYKLSRRVTAAAYLQLKENGHSIIQKNNEANESNGYKPISLEENPLSEELKKINLYSFNHAFDLVGGTPALDDEDMGETGLEFEYNKGSWLEADHQDPEDQTKDKVHGAQRVMAEIINASRFDNYTIHRTPGAGVESMARANDEHLDNANNEINKKTDKDSWLKKIANMLKEIRKYILKALIKVVSKLDLGIFVGTTILMTDKNDYVVKNQPFKTDKNIQNKLLNAYKDTPETRYSRGTAVVVADYFKFFGQEYPFGIYSTANDWANHPDAPLPFNLLGQGPYGRYCRHIRNFVDVGSIINIIMSAMGKDEKDLHLSRLGGIVEPSNPVLGDKPRPDIPPSIAIGGYINNPNLAGSIGLLNMVKNKNFIQCDPYMYLFPWQGIKPYMKFNPDSKDPDFNQPNVYVYLQRKSADLDQSGDGKNKTAMNVTMGSASFKGGEFATKELLGDDLSGLHALSRAQVYYHRPGAWKEHPNLFNPFWRARLAPVADSYDRSSDRHLLNHVQNEVLHNLLGGGSNKYSIINH